MVSDVAGRRLQWVQEPTPPVPRSITLEEGEPIAAFVLAPPDPPVPGQESARLHIFPGAATPTVFPARTPFWIGYGFVVEPGEPESQRELSSETTFELIVDGDPVRLESTSRIADGRTVARQYSAIFPMGLAPGWHRVQGRWYDDGRLIISSHASIQFVEA